MLVLDKSYTANVNRHPACLVHGCALGFLLVVPLFVFFLNVPLWFLWPGLLVGRPGM